ncbi:FAD/NAD(P)-binding domain-containing protein [Saccharata proteae CBS 121410]|uniref:FAD/NAD(P)-binding domain-containing protein n=1 Tax=Saccharata proteae CBS 121410 TaxID=1314787 RepID=A0A9P4HR75_9PEZI|nr:FAD/NAD(P)-binding domain-containing protein [Saccharata proteae CBS 121410]
MQEPVLIVGAGVVGLTLGQALKKRDIPFRIFERDSTPTARGQGWAITLHWSLPFLREMLPADIFDRIHGTQVDPINAANDKGNFLFLDLRDCSIKFKIPPNERWRVNREKMRQTLLSGIEENVEWGKKVVDARIPEAKDSPATLIFDDGSKFDGSMIVGVEGSNSTIRQLLSPNDYKNAQLPIRFLGVGIDMTPFAIAPLRALDPLLFQGLHPQSRTFMWFSTLETPESNGTAGTVNERYRAQINISWPVIHPEDEIKSTNSEKLAQMKARASMLDDRLRKVVEGIPDDTLISEIKLADWECKNWDNRDGRMTLAGDAAHAMTMYRGEAANHGLLDALRLCQALEKIQSGNVGVKVAMDEYEQELRERTSKAVLMSRQACYDAHTWENLNEGCAVLARRAINSRSSK